MIAYADKSFYTEEYMGDVIPDELLDKALVKGTFAVQLASTSPIGDLTLWPEFTQRQVKLATCEMAEHWHKESKKGELSEILSVTGGYSIGDVSVSAAQKAIPPVGSDDAYLAEFGLTKQAYAFLLPTGLLDRRLA